jgi:hypothetical protein
MLAEDALALFLARERGTPAGRLEYSAAAARLPSPAAGLPVTPFAGIPGMPSLAGLPPESFAALMADFPFAFNVGPNLTT